MGPEDARALDEADPLRPMRERFRLRHDIIYLDGNSLGALPRSTPAHLADVVERMWGEDLITSWNRHGWIDWPERIAAKLAPIIGAAPGEILIADSTTVSLFKLLAAAALARPGRRTILTQQGNFPTDIYAAQGLARLRPELEIKTVPEAELENALGEDTAVLMLTHVDYRSGARHDLVKLNRAARAVGALNLWDLSHSAGAIEVDLGATGCDLAVGCGYKFLNGGPGAPAFVYVSERLSGKLVSPLAGWMGHREPFAFEVSYEPSADIRGFLTGTPPVLALAALECGLDTFDGVRISQVEEKSRLLTQFFIDAVEREDRRDLVLASPREPGARGSHVCFSHPQGYAVMQALIARGIIGDFRPPDLMRFGFAPLYNSYEDAFTAAKAMVEILETGEWDRPGFLERQKVT